MELPLTLLLLFARVHKLEVLPQVYEHLLLFCS